MVLTLLEDNPKDESTAALTETVRRRCYTQAEIAFAAQELLYDNRLDRKLSFPGGKVTAADFDTHVQRIKQLRARLKMPLRQDDVNDLIASFPDWLSWSDFGIADYTAANTPLYRFSFSGKVDGHAPKPVLYDNERPGADRTEGTGLSAIGDLL